MKQQYVLSQLDDERRCLVYDGQSVEALPLVTRAKYIGTSQQTIIFSAVTDETADATIAEQVEYYRGLGVEVEWKVFAHDKPHDLSQRLERHGFVAGEHEAVVVLDLQIPPAWITAPPQHRVERVTTPELVDLFRVAAGKIFNKDYNITSQQLRESLRTGTTQQRGYVALDENDVAVGVGQLYTHPHSVFGGLYTGGVVEQFRSRGCYRALVAARARDAMELGAKYLLVDALPTSCPILLRLGFEQVTETWPMVLRR